MCIINWTHSHSTCTLRFRNKITKNEKPLKSANLNSSQVKIKFEFSKPFRSKRISKDEKHAEIEQFPWPFNYLQNSYKTIIQ